MKRKIYLVEILEDVAKAKSKKDKIHILHSAGNNVRLQEILKLTYDPEIKFIVNRKELDTFRYVHLDIPDYDCAATTLLNESRRIVNYTNLRNPPIRFNRVCQLIINMFSGLHNDDIELFKQMTEGRFKCNGLTKKLIMSAFPGIITEESKKENKEDKEDKKENKEEKVDA